MRRARRARHEQPERDPQLGRQDRERHAQVRGEAEVAHARVVDQAALDHVPAERALQRAEREDARQLPRERAVDAPAHREPDEGQQEHRADGAPEQAVEVLPPEDALEAGQVHRVVDLLELGGLLVLGESSFHRASVSGGTVPTSGCHSTIDSPEWVSRVTPPTTTMANTIAAHNSSQRATARRGLGLMAGCCIG